MTVSTFVFKLPMPPNYTNRGSGRSHWRHIHREKREYFRRCDDLQALGIIPPPPFHPLTRAVVSAVMYLGSPMDDDNAMARCSKFPLDWIKSRGYIVDDRKKNLNWRALPVQVIGRKHEYRIEITLEVA